MLQIGKPIEGICHILTTDTAMRPHHQTANTSQACMPTQPTGSAASIAPTAAHKEPRTYGNWFPLQHTQPPGHLQREDSPANTSGECSKCFIPINLIEETTDDREIASITNSSRSHHKGFTTSTGTTPGDSSRSGFYSEHSAFSVYLRDSRMNPKELYIPDKSGETITQKAGTIMVTCQMDMKLH